MAQNNLGAPGVGLPYPQFLLPNSLLGGSNFPPQSEISLAPSQCIPIPPGVWMVVVGRYTFIQFLDPVSGVWLPLKTVPGVPKQIKSDGINYRVANLTGCPVNAVVTNAGSGYPATGTTVTSSGTGGSQWAAVVGGMVTSITVTAAGSGYGIPPLVYIPPPPAGGIQATAYAALTNGSISGITVVNQGGGYPSIPAVAIVQSPYDPTTSSVSAATASIAAGGFVAQSTGSIAAVICTNPGASVSSAPTLTISGTGGSAAAATANLLTVATAFTVGGAGAGYSAGTFIQALGGIPSATTVNTQPFWEVDFVHPRPALASVTIAGGTITSISKILDAGMFLGTPAVVTVANAVITTAATVTVAQGGTADVVILAQC